MFENLFGRAEPKKTKPRSSIERVVGGITEKEKKAALHMMTERFEDQIPKKILEGRERKKTETELKIIQLANGATNELRRLFGLSDFDIPPKNIHIVRKDEWPFPDREAAFYAMREQSVVMRESESKMSTAARIVHEMIHFKSYNALQATMTNWLEPYRIGLSVHDRKDTKVHFKNLNEALTEELTMRVVKRDLFRDPVFSHEIGQTASMKAAARDPDASSREKILDENVYCARNDVVGGENVTHLYGFGYQRERAVLSLLIDKIYARHSDTFKDRDRVLELFARGMMTGNLLELGRLIDGTFGKGALRSIAEMDDDVGRQLSYVQSL